MTKSYEEEAKELIKKMQSQFQILNPKVDQILERNASISNEVVDHSQGQNLGIEQGLLKNENLQNSVTPLQTQTITPGIQISNELPINTGIQPGTPPKPAPVSNICPQCGMIHPPLKAGEKCPNAKVEVKSDEGKEVDVNKYIVIWRDVVLSQIGSKNIKDPEKLFKNITIELTKFLEGYQE